MEDEAEESYKPDESEEASDEESGEELAEGSEEESGWVECCGRVGRVSGVGQRERKIKAEQRGE